MQSIEAWIDSQIRNPARSLLHGPLEPFERLIVLARGGTNDAELVREEAFVAAQSLEILRNAQRLTAILQNSQRATEPTEHHGAIRRATYRFLQRRDSLSAAPESLERPAREEVPPMEAGFHADDSLRLCQRF